MAERAKGYIPMNNTKKSTRVEEISETSEPWFLDMHKDEAVDFLREAASRNEGNFCVRLSEKYCYAISLLNRDKELHYAITKVDGMYVLELGIKPPSMRSLKEVVKYFQDECQGSVPIHKTGSDYNNVIISTLGKPNNKHNNNNKSINDNISNNFNNSINKVKVYNNNKNNNNNNGNNINSNNNNKGNNSNNNNNSNKGNNSNNSKGNNSNNDKDEGSHNRTPFKKQSPHYVNQQTQPQRPPAPRPPNRSSSLSLATTPPPRIPPPLNKKLLPWNSNNPRKLPKQHSIDPANMSSVYSNGGDDDDGGDGGGGDDYAEPDVDIEKRRRAMSLEKRRVSMQNGDYTKLVIS